MGTFLKKDILVLLRDRAELYILLLMPLILIIILGFALGGLLGGNTTAIQMQVAIVQEDDEQLGIDEFVETLIQLEIPEDRIQQLELVANQISPNTILTTMFQSDEFSDIVKTVDMTSSAAEQALKAGEITAILTIPENFTYRALQKTLLGEGGGSSLQVKVDETGSFRARVFHDIIDSFVHTFNFEAALHQSLGRQGEGELTISSDISHELGGIETVSRAKPVSSFQYYTIGMAVMFVLYVSTTIASKAYVEKQQHVFNRILLANKHPFVYLGGKFISGMIIAIFQLLILFTITSLIFEPLGDQTPNFLLGMFAISVVLATSVGAFAALLTAISVRFDNQGVINIFSGGVVSIFAFLGGSFFPTSGLHPIISQLGTWTPNGAALSAYIQWMQGLPLEFIISPLTRIAVLSILLLVVSFLIFPRRRSV